MYARRLDRDRGVVTGGKIVGTRKIQIDHSMYIVDIYIVSFVTLYVRYRWVFA